MGFVKRGTSIKVKIAIQNFDEVKVQFLLDIDRLYAIDAYMCHTTFSLWCHFRQCPWDLRFVSAERVKQGEVGRFSTLDPGNMAASGLSCRKTLVSPGWAISLLLCMNGLRKWSSGHVGPPFLAVRLYGICRDSVDTIYTRKSLEKSRTLWPSTIHLRVFSWPTTRPVVWKASQKYRTRKSPKY